LSSIERNGRIIVMKCAATYPFVAAQFKVRALNRVGDRAGVNGDVVVWGAMEQ